METCEGCGSCWDAVEPGEVAGRLRAAGRRIGALLAVDTDHAARHEPGRWSSLEYAAHVRDVPLNVRDRMILALAQDVPHPPSMYPALRVDAGLYTGETAGLLAADISCVTEIFVRFTQALGEPVWQRRLVYPWPRETERTLVWAAAQVVHELEHHGDDISANTLTGLDALFHVTERATWELGEPDLTGSTRGRTLEQEGFIHLSTAAQLPGVLDRFYADIRDQVVVLRIDPRALPAHAVRFDLVGAEVYPHLYAPLPRDAVRDVA